MAQIRIEGKVAAAWGDHLYLVYVNDAGQEFVIRGGPERDLDEEGAGFGNILTVSDVLLANSEDARPVSDRDDRGSLVLDLGGRDAASVWNIMVQTSKLINRSAIDYDFLTQNSNSVISAVLHSVGINYSNNLPDQPWNNDSYPGASNLLLDDFQRAFSGTSKSDKIFGGSLNDLLKGNSGNDTLSGGNGNDSLYGGSENDIIQGSAGNDLIVGEWGKDTLYGGSGTDWFAFNTAASSTNIDTIIGYSVADDTFMLDDAVYSRIFSGSLSAPKTLLSSAFAKNTTGYAGDSSDRIIYETDTGKLYYDADGNGTGARVHFATIATNLSLTYSDFLIY